MGIQWKFHNENWDWIHSSRDTEDLGRLVPLWSDRFHACQRNFAILLLPYFFIFHASSQLIKMMIYRKILKLKREHTEKKLTKQTWKSFSSSFAYQIQFYTSILQESSKHHHLFKNVPWISDYDCLKKPRISTSNTYTQVVVINYSDFCADFTTIRTFVVAQYSNWLRLQKRRVEESESHASVLCNNSQVASSSGKSWGFKLIFLTTSGLLNLILADLHYCVTYVHHRSSITMGFSRHWCFFRWNVYSRHVRASNENKIESE